MVPRTGFGIVDKFEGLSQEIVDAMRYTNLCVTVPKEYVTGA